jgi:hypothetical protein
MDEKTKLILAIHQVEGITNLTKGNPYQAYIHRHLNTIKVELERQLTLNTIFDDTRDTEEKDDD